MLWHNIMGNRPHFDETVAQREEASAPEQTYETRKAPRLKRVAEGEVNFGVSTCDQMRELYGTKSEEAANLLLISALNAFGRNNDEYFDLMPAMAVALEPRDAVEAMLVTQMTATHLAITTMAQKFHHTDYPDVREAYERSMTRLSRTFLSQMKAFKKYRTKAQQVVRVERVEVNEGGKANVGDVSHRRGEDDEK